MTNVHCRLWKRAHFQSKQAVDVATLISTDANTGIYFQFSFCSFFSACSVKRRCRFLLACQSEILKLGTGTSSCQRTLRNCCNIDSIPASSIRWLGASGSARVWERCRWSCCSLKLCVCERACDVIAVLNENILILKQKLYWNCSLTPCTYCMSAHIYIRWQEIVKK